MVTEMVVAVGISRGLGCNQVCNQVCNKRENGVDGYKEMCNYVVMCMVHKEIEESRGN